MQLLYEAAKREVSMRGTEGQSATQCSGKRGRERGGGVGGCLKATHLYKGEGRGRG